MKEIQGAKKLEVAQYYLLGYTYGEIEELTGVSHGSIANIIRDIESGKLVIPGTAFDQVNDLRQLSFDLKKKGLEPSQALLGLLVFERLGSLEITPELLDKWAELMKTLSPADFPAKDFLEVALRLHELEKNEDKPFDSLAEEYKKLQDGSEKLKNEVDSLRQSKQELSIEVEPLNRQIEALNRTKQSLENEVEMKTAKRRDLKSTIKEAEEERSQLNKEIKDLQRRKVKLSSEVDRKEESLRRLNDIGLSDDDLLRLTTFFERMSKSEGVTPEQIKERFLSTLNRFKELGELERIREVEAQKVKELAREKSVLDGAIKELGKTKGVLEGEIGSIATSISQNIRAIGQDAAQQVHQQVTGIREQMGDLFVDTLKAGEAIGQMRQMVRKGEESEKSLEKFLQETRNRLVGS